MVFFWIHSAVVTSFSPKVSYNTKGGKDNGTIHRCIVFGQQRLSFFAVVDNGKAGRCVLPTLAHMCRSSGGVCGILFFVGNGIWFFW